jgi:hypothetical protein
MRNKLSRRAVLRGAGGVAIGLPFLGAMMDARRTVAQPGEIPKRFVAFFTANGTLAERWRPSGGETDFALSEILEPLEPHRSDIIVLDGIDMRTAIESSGGRNGHDIGMGHCLVARPLVEGPSGFGEFGHLWDGSAGGISLDQEIANHLGAESRYRSLEFGLNAFIRQAIPSRLSWRAPFEPVPPMDDPATAFDRIFGGGVSDPRRLAELQAQRTTVLDAVMDDYHRLNVRLGADDRRRLDAHLTAIRDVEGRISAIDTTTACEEPARPAEGGAYPAKGVAHMELMAMAMACELTPVTSMQWSTAQGGVRFEWLGVDRGHHDLSHDGDSNEDTKNKIAAINHWYAEQFAYLLARLKEIPEADGGTLLDHSVVLWCNELGRGNSHMREDIPYVLAGGAGGNLRTGRYLRYGNEPHGNFFVSIMNALGIDATTFGDPEYCTGPLTGLLT